MAACANHPSAVVPPAAAASSSSSASSARNSIGARNSISASASASASSSTAISTGTSTSTSTTISTTISTSSAANISSRTPTRVPLPRRGPDRDAIDDGDGSLQKQAPTTSLIAPGHPRGARDPLQLKTAAAAAASDDGRTRRSRALAHAAATQTPPSNAGSSSSLSIPAARKPSPGLAARLKALGFGSSKKQAPTHDPVGRLDQQHLRRLDERHQAASLSPAIARRGRPWKGAVAVAMDPDGDGLSSASASPPPPPPPKDSPKDPPRASDDYVPGLSSYFTPGHNRPGSIYTLSRASFANQLAQLTSLQLPDADSLSGKVTAIRSAQAAAKALINAADQICGWIAKAHDVIGGLDSDDDVEWAAAGGREGLDDVENAIVRFEDLINVYVGAIEELPTRADISAVAADDLERAVSQMEFIIDDWAKIRATLHVVRAQVEIAMEWEELWSSVLGDIQAEMDDLARLVFEMEERRHRTIDGVDIGDLETIVEDAPAPSASRLQPLAPHARLSLSALPASPGSPGLSQDDSSLLALFARMQPLRASLDFLPMRLSGFEARARQAFPTACDELDMRRRALDASYRKLERDAESLRKELGEDRWVIVFRGAGRQAQKMLESVQRSLLKLTDAIDAGLHLTSPAAMTKKVDGYEAKKTHYGPAIERVLSIIDRGVKDRLTVNGEILRLHADVQARWRSLKTHMVDMDALLDDMHVDHKGQQQLRDSVSSMLSYDRSTVASGRDTPGSSPPSSVIMSTLGFDPHTPVAKPKGRSPAAAAAAAASSASRPAGKRHSSLPAPTSQLMRQTASRLSTIASSSASTPASSAKTPRPASSLGARLPWNASTNTTCLDTGHNFKPLTLTTPSPYARSTPRSASALSPSSAGSRLPTLRNPLARAASESPRVREPTPSRPSHSRLASRERMASPGPYAQHDVARPRLSSQPPSVSARSTKRRATIQPPPPSGSDSTSHEGRTSRPASSLASTSRRSSLLPLPWGGKDASSTGRASPQRATPSRLGARKTTPVEAKDMKPRWRH